MDNAILGIIITGTFALVGGGFATWQQLRKDARVNNVELIRLQEDIEKDLWARMKAEFATMQSRLDRQDATIQEQGALILQLRDTVQRQGDRIKILETENAMLKAENEQLKESKTKPTGKMNL